MSLSLQPTKDSTSRTAGSMTRDSVRRAGGLVLVGKPENRFPVLRSVSASLERWEKREQASNSRSRAARFV
jgi:hypothetical protein